MSFDSRLITVEPFTPHSFEDLASSETVPPDYKPSYQKWVELFHKLDDVVVNRIVYDVDGLKVTGVMAVPKDIDPKGAPILIYNRGGSGELGKLNAVSIQHLIAPLVRAGYLVFASNYRGNDGGEGTDEFGGRDVQDVLELLDIARNHPEWDGKNAYMMGHSRGCMMTQLAIKHGAKLNAAATIAGVSDLWQSAEERPEMESVHAERMPDFEHTREEAYEERSALRWVDRLNVPLLLMHGTEDWRVDVSHSERLGEALQKAGKICKTVIYQGDDHSLTENYADAVNNIKNWFALHKTRERSATSGMAR